MPRRKKLPTIPDYTDGGRSPDKLLVQKTNPLITLSETNMTLPEFKILDAYLARIDSHNPEKRFIRLEKGAIERLLGVTQIKPQDLEKRIRNLFQTVRIRDERMPKGFTMIALFEKATCYQDDDGLWQVDLGASQSAMEYIFNPENIGYLRYRLANVVNLTSRYSYIMYLYLEHDRFRKSWDIDLDELKDMLRCTADTYKQFKRFNDLVLKKCHKELTEKTTLRYTYEPVRRGRSIKAVRFTVETITPLELPGQITMDDFTSERDVSDHQSDDEIGFLLGACTPIGMKEPEFSRLEMEQLWQVLAVIDESKLPYISDGTFNKVDLMKFRRYHYLAERYAAMNRVHARKPIKHRFAYMLKLLKADAETA